MIFAPAPLLVTARRLGLLAALLASAVGAAIALVLTLASGSGSAGGALFGYLLAAVLPAAVLTGACARSATGVGAITRASAVMVGFFLLLFGGFLLSPGDPLGRMEGEVARQLDELIGQVRTQSVGDGPLTELTLELQVIRDRIVRWVPRLLPSVVFVGVVLASWLNVIHARWVVGPLGREDDLCRFRLPMATMSTFTVAGAWVAVVLLRPDLLPGSEAGLWVAANVLLALSFLYSLAGLAVANWFIFRLPLPLWARMVLIGAGALPPDSYDGGVARPRRVAGRMVRCPEARRWGPRDGETR